MTLQVFFLVQREKALSQFLTISLTSSGKKQELCNNILFDSYFTTNYVGDKKLLLSAIQQETKRDIHELFW